MTYHEGHMFFFFHHGAVRFLRKKEGDSYGYSTSSYDLLSHVAGSVLLLKHSVWVYTSGKLLFPCWPFREYAHLAC